MIRNRTPPVEDLPVKSIYDVQGLRTPINNIKIVLLSKSGRVIFLDKKTNTTDFNLDIGGTDYRVRKEGLYKKDQWLYREIIDRVIRSRQYWIIFNEGEPDHLVPSNPVVSPYELYMINTSTSISKALNEYVSGSFLGGKGGFILVVLALIAGYYLVSTGAISL